MGNSGKNTARTVNRDVKITIRNSHISSAIGQDRGVSLGMSLCHCLGLWLEECEDWRVAVLFHKDTSTGQKGKPG